MGKVYDDWERLVEAVLRREKLRQLCYAHSITSSDSSSVLDHDFLHLHAKMNMARLQEELIYNLTQNKLRFGLDTLPYSVSPIENNSLGSFDESFVNESSSFEKTDKTKQVKVIQPSSPSKNSWKEPISPRWRNFDGSVKPMSRLPIEPAPWKHNDGTRASQKPVLRNARASSSKAPTVSPSVYSEIEKRLRDLEFTQSGKDLRALKQILEAMQGKGRLKTPKDDQGSNFDIHKNREQTTMARFQEELIYTLNRNKQCFEQGYLSPHTSDLTVISPRQSISSESEDCVVDLLDPDVIPEIKVIAATMFASSCYYEFCQVFVRFGKAAFDVYFTVLDVEELSSSEDFGLMERKSFNSIVKKWRCAIKKFIVLYLYRAKLVFDQVLEYGDASSRCLIEASKPSLMWFLNSGRDLAFAPHRPENLLCLFYIYEGLTELIPSIEALFTNEMGACVLIELHNLLTMLEDSAKATLMWLVNAIHTDPSSTPFPDGRIHPLMRYVVKFILCFEEYDRTLGLIFKEKDCEDVSADADHKLSIASGALATHLRSITSALEAKIATISVLYDDPSLEHIFVMNNIHYMVEKISSSSKIKAYFGDEWIRRRTIDFSVRALSYERSTWSSILPLLRLGGKVDRATAKARCRDFAVAFGNVHKNQTRWLVPNLGLRQELRISASITVVNAYRFFLGSVKNVLGDKHVKYSVHELETLILDLFEGSSNSLPSNAQMEEKGQKERPT